MKIATTLAVLALTLLPAVAATAACRGDETAASCLPGLVWDEGKGTCVEKPTS
jgi:hypothetical protein